MFSDYFQSTFGRRFCHGCCIIEGLPWLCEVLHVQWLLVSSISVPKPLLQSYNSLLQWFQTRKYPLQNLLSKTQGTCHPSRSMAISLVLLQTTQMIILVKLMATELTTQKPMGIRKTRISAGWIMNWRCVGSMTVPIRVSLDLAWRLTWMTRAMMRTTLAHSTLSPLCRTAHQ